MLINTPIEIHILKFYAKNMLKVAISGYGRIGRIAHRVILERFTHDIKVVGINAGGSTDIIGWMYLLKYDTVYHTLNSKFKISSFARTSEDKQNSTIQNRNDYIGSLIINDERIPVFSQKDPSLLPWKDLDVDVVIESTGVFRREEQLKPHLDAGAKAVVLSAPFRGKINLPTYIISVNLSHDKQSGGEKIISNASCTTNCITPVAQVIEENLGIEKAMMTTIHAYTSDQRLQDGGHKDYRRARAAAQNIIPTSTGATEAAAKAMPALAGKFSGLAIRVPVITGSLSDFTFLVKRGTTVDEVNQIFEKSTQEDKYKNIIEVTRDPIVSSDIIGNLHSAIVDLSLTQVVGGNMVKVIAWYDNEYGYANRLVEEVAIIGKQVADT